MNPRDAEHSADFFRVVSSTFHRNQMSLLKYGLHFALLISMLSCNYFSSSEKKEEPIARVYDKYLYQSSLAGVGKGAATPDDSILAVRNYIDSWIRHNLVLRYAQDNLPEEEQRLDNQLLDYKESLLIYAYEKELLSAKLDTMVSEPEIEKYYDDHRETFNLKTGIAEMKYIMLRADDKIKFDSAQAWMKNSTDYTYPKLRAFCKRYAVRFSINDSTWYNKDELQALLPTDQFNLDNAQYNRSYLVVSDSSYKYLIKFDDYRIKGSDAPIDFVRNEITGIIINQRKMAFISSIHKSIYEDGLKNNEFEVYGSNTNAEPAEKGKSPSP